MEETFLFKFETKKVKGQNVKIEIKKHFHNLQESGKPDLNLSLSNLVCSDFYQISVCLFVSKPLSKVSQQKSQQLRILIVFLNY